MKPKPGLITIPCPMACRPPAMVGGLNDGEDDRQVARPLGDLAPAQLAFLLQLFQRRNDHGQQLQNDRRRDVRHDAQGENGQLADVAAGEHVEEAEDGALLRAEEFLPALDVDARRGDLAAQPVHGQHAQREQDPLAKVGDAEDVARTLRKTSWLPSIPGAPQAVAPITCALPPALAILSSRRLRELMRFDRDGPRQLARRPGS